MMMATGIPAMVGSGWRPLRETSLGSGNSEGQWAKQGRQAESRPKPGIQALISGVSWSSIRMI